MTERLPRWVLDFYRGNKIRVNRLLDRGMDFANLVLEDAHPVPGRLRPVIHWLGDALWLARALPRQSAYRLAGNQWQVVFVGTEHSRLTLEKLLFDEKPRAEDLGRVAFSSLGRVSRKWLDDGVDMVVCELSRIHPWRLQAPIHFSIPSWIRQVIPLPEDLDKLISGRRMKSVRHNLNRAAKADFKWYFSQNIEDFRLFYYRMYLPFIKARHGELALISPYADQWKRWFQRGGLIMVTSHGQAVGGVLCFVHDETCHAVEMGVLDANPELVEQNIKISADWYSMKWGHQQGARFFDMGGTRPWQTDGVFTYKSRWHPRVIDRGKIVSQWTFLADELRPSLQASLNRMGLISKIKGAYYALWITMDGQLDVAALEARFIQVKNQGLAGLAIIQPGKRKQLVRSTADIMSVNQ